VNEGKNDFVKISSRKMENEFLLILLKNNFSDDKAKVLAQVFTENSIDGVYTHGVNRFPPFIKYVQEKIIDVNAEAAVKNSVGAIEQWDGNYAAGPLNAIKSTDRALELASKFGIGCVALANTNHWMRGGTYGWKAANAGFVFIGWTNTIGIMPAWGAKDARLGNNPIVFALPFNDEAIVLDMAMSQFSYGKMEVAKRKGEQLSVPGGYDKNGNLTTDPAEILESQRPLPIGYWKGAGLALLLDLLATVLSGGLATHEISGKKHESSISQVFIAIDLSKLDNNSSVSKTINQIIDNYKDSVHVSDSAEILYPGERVLRTRKENLLNGIPVHRTIWDRIQNL
jgi:3-dehydro-L-gulonate 2-dehydrogenase